MRAIIRSAMVTGAIAISMLAAPKKAKAFDDYPVCIEKIEKRVETPNGRLYLWKTKACLELGPDGLVARTKIERFFCEGSKDTPFQLSCSKQSK